MKLRHYRQLIVRAVADKDDITIDRLAAALMEAEDAKRILRLKGYGDTGQTVNAAARLVPAAMGDGS